MKEWGKVILVFLFFASWILLIALNVYNIDKHQNKAQNYSVEQLY